MIDWMLNVCQYLTRSEQINCPLTEYKCIKMLLWYLVVRGVGVVAVGDAVVVFGSEGGRCGR